MASRKENPASHNPRRIPYAAAQDYFHNLPRARGHVGFERGPGAVSTQESGFESVRNGKAHGSAERECVGAGLRAGLTILDQRRRLRLVDTLRWPGSREELAGLSPIGNRRRPGVSDRNCLQRVARLSTTGMA